MPQTKAEYDRVYNQTSVGKKRNRISKWKSRGIISDDWDALYERYLNTTQCDSCNVLLTDNSPRTRTTKCLDHDHSIKDRENVRGILCHGCNMNDRCDNKSGVPNVHYRNGVGKWVYQKWVGGVSHQKYFKTKEDTIRYKYEFES